MRAQCVYGDDKQRGHCVFVQHLETFKSARYKVFSCTRTFSQFKKKKNSLAAGDFAQSLSLKPSLPRTSSSFLGRLVKGREAENQTHYSKEGDIEDACSCTEFIF